MGLTSNIQQHICKLAMNFQHANYYLQHHSNLLLVDVAFVKPNVSSNIYVPGEHLLTTGSFMNINLMLC